MTTRPGSSYTIIISTIKLLIVLENRFGKFIKIHFSKVGRIIGASIEKYLLEKTRITHQCEGERNFHIFFQLMRGADENLRAKIRLRSNSTEYRYLNSSSATSIPKVDDSKEFSLTCECMSSVGIAEDMQQHVFALISGLLSLGNVVFEEDVNDGTVKGLAPGSDAYLEDAAALFGLDCSSLLKQMTHQNMHVGAQVIVKSQNTVQASDKRDSFSKSIYTMLFSWLVDKINEMIAVGEGSSGWIGVLVIPSQNI